MSITGYRPVVNAAGEWVGPDTGLVGPTGPQGLRGPTGPQGLRGPTGPIAGENRQVIYNNNGTPDGADIYFDATTGNVGIGTSSSTSILTIAGIPEYASNNEAISAGLTTGAIYRTGGILSVVIPTPTPTPTNTLTLTPTPTPTNVPIVISVGNMISISPGVFTQGSPGTEFCRGTNEAQFSHTLTRNIVVMQTELTRQMWADLRVVQGTLPDDPSYTPYSPTMSHPVQQVTWYEAVLFANLLSSQNGYTRCYYTDAGFTTPVTVSNYTTGPFYCDFSADGYRLPTEGEWEYICRAGTTGAFSCNETNYTSDTCNSCTSGTHPTLAQYCVYCANDPGITAPVGEKLSNPWNLKDVHGNVWEWCWDWYNATYPSGSAIDFSGPGSGSARVTRGGAFNAIARGCRSAQRSDLTPDIRYVFQGFRFVRTAN